MGLMDLNGYQMNQGHKRMPSHQQQQQQQQMPPFHMPPHAAMSTIIKREINNTLGLSAAAVMDANLEQQADLLLARQQHNLNLKHFQSQPNEEDDEDMENDEEVAEDDGLNDDGDDRCMSDNANMLNESNLTAQDLSLPMNISSAMIRNRNTNH